MTYLVLHHAFRTSFDDRALAVVDSGSIQAVFSYLREVTHDLNYMPGQTLLQENNTVKMAHWKMDHLKYQL